MTPISVRGDNNISSTVDLGESGWVDSTEWGELGLLDPTPNSKDFENDKTAGAEGNDCAISTLH